MSRAQVRTKVASWIAANPPTNLNQVFTSFPKRINFQQNSTAGQMTRAALVVHIMSEDESRIAVGGASDGWKRIDYQVDCQIFCHSMQNYAQDAMDDFDAIVDAVKDQLRAGGHRLGESTGDVIWQAAEPGISATYGEPVTNDGGAVELWCSLIITVTQMVRA